MNFSVRSKHITMNLDEYQFYRFILNEPFCYDKNVLIGIILNDYFNHNVNNVFNCQIRNLVQRSNYYSFDCCYQQDRLFTTVYVREGLDLFRQLSRLHYYTPNFYYHYFSYNCDRDACSLTISKKIKTYHLQELIDTVTIDNQLTVEEVGQLALQGLSCISLGFSQGIILKGLVNDLFTCQRLSAPITVPIYLDNQIEYLNTRVLLRVNGLKAKKTRVKILPRLTDDFLDQLSLATDKAIKLPELLTVNNNWNFPDPNYLEKKRNTMNNKTELPYSKVYLSDIGNSLTLQRSDRTFSRVWLEREFSEGLVIPGYQYINDRLLSIDINSLQRLFAEPESAEKQLLISLIANGIRSSDLMSKIAWGFKNVAEGVYGKVTIIRKGEQDLFAFKTPKQKIAEIYHENLVGQVINQLRKMIPNFMYVYGIYDKPGGWCEKCQGVLLIENISQGMKLKHFVKQARNQEIISIALQAMNSFYLAYNQYNFSHNDFHLGNLMIQRLPEKIDIPLFDRQGKILAYLHTDWILRIIDYGKSIVKYQGVLFKGGNNDFNPKLTPLLDIFIFLVELYALCSSNALSIAYYLLTRDKINNLVRLVNQADKNDQLYQDDKITIESNGLISEYTPFHDHEYFHANFLQSFNYLITNLSASPEYLSSTPVTNLSYYHQVKSPDYYNNLLFDFTPEEQEAEVLISISSSSRDQRYLNECSEVKDLLKQNLEQQKNPSQRYNHQLLINRLDKIITVNKTLK